VQYISTRTATEAVVVIDIKICNSLYLLPALRYDYTRSRVNKEK